jgi:hypothetical protein
LYFSLLVDLVDLSTNLGKKDEAEKYESLLIEKKKFFQVEVLGPSLRTYYAGPL